MDVNVNSLFNPNTLEILQQTSLDCQNETMLRSLQEHRKWIGKSPLVKLDFEPCNLFAKLESYNCTGSIKDWAAYNIMNQAIKSGSVTQKSIIVESSSGNFAIALGFLCKRLGLKFIPVIDPNINSNYEKLLNVLCEDVVKVELMDETGGYLLTRIKTVQEICLNYSDSFWPNQYENENNFKGYYNGLAPEIAGDFNRLDYLFVAVSSCGTVTGLSLRLKEIFPDIKIIAVDIEGSVIFGEPPAPRYVSGIGASKVPSILKNAQIDDVVHVSQLDLIVGCKELLDDQFILAGASSGSVYYAIKKYFEAKDVDPASNAVFISADNGKSYLDTIYNAEWQNEMKEKLK